jgi:hypothetical protein
MNAGVFFAVADIEAVEGAMAKVIEQAAAAGK